MGIIKNPSRTILIIIITAVLIFVPAIAICGEPLASPTASAVLVDGEIVQFDAYNIEGNNYFKLRDLAYALNNGAKSFEITFDNTLKAIILTSNQPYTPVGGEMTIKGGGKVTPIPNTSKVYLNDLQILPTAYNIEGNTYFKLRDIAQALDFCVEWDAENSIICIDTGRGYGQLAEPVPLAQMPASLHKIDALKIGETIDESLLGEARRIINDNAVMEVRLYGNYQDFYLLCVSGGKIVYIYTNNAAYRNTAEKLFTDNNDNGAVYAASSGTIPPLTDKTTEQVIFELTNAFRGYHHLDALRWNDTLGQIALQHSRDMSARNYFAHENPDGLTPDARLTKGGYNWRACAENIVAGYQNGFDAVDVLINSALHRKNFLTVNCDELGVGWIKAEKGKYAFYGTQLFGRSKN